MAARAQAKGCPVGGLALPRLQPNGPTGAKAASDCSFVEVGSSLDAGRPDANRNEGARVRGPVCRQS